MTPVNAFKDACRIHKFNVQEGAEKIVIKVLKEKFNMNVDLSVTETQHFERRLDPKEAMGTGMQRKIINELCDFQHSYGVGSINIRRYSLNSELYLEVEYYSVVMNDVLKECFSQDYFSNIKSQSAGKSWRITYYLYIKPEYQKIFKNAFDKEGYIKESLNFERGLDPKDAMETGDIEGRTKESKF